MGYMVPFPEAHGSIPGVRAEKRSCIPIVGLTLQVVPKLGHAGAYLPGTTLGHRPRAFLCSRSMSVDSCK